MKTQFLKDNKKFKKISNEMMDKLASDVRKKILVKKIQGNCDAYCLRLLEETET